MVRKRITYEDIGILPKIRLQRESRSIINGKHKTDWIDEHTTFVGTDNEFEALNIGKRKWFKKQTK